MDSNFQFRAAATAAVARCCLVACQNQAPGRAPQFRSFGFAQRTIPWSRGPDWVERVAVCDDAAPPPVRAGGKVSWTPKMRQVAKVEPCP
jgi:hypothetical protein